MCSAIPPLPSRAALPVYPVETAGPGNAFLFVCFFCCGLIIDAVNFPDYVMLNGVTTHDWPTGRDFEMVMTYPKFFAWKERLTATTKNISEDTRLVTQPTFHAFQNIIAASTASVICFCSQRARARTHTHTNTYTDTLEQSQ
jgi:hypothetical protein